jgi:hypothetical protein
MMHAWQLVQAIAQANSSSSSSSSAGAQQQQQQPSLADLGLLLPGESVLIIGGGLTSAHLAQIAAKQLRQTPPPTNSITDGTSSRSQKAAADISNAANNSYNAEEEYDESAAGQPAPPISLLMRGPWRVKQFDVDVGFMGRLRGRKLQEYGQLRSFSQRLALIKQVLQVREEFVASMLSVFVTASSRCAGSTLQQSSNRGDTTEYSVVITHSGCCRGGIQCVVSMYTCDSFSACCTGHCSSYWW